MFRTRFLSILMTAVLVQCGSLKNGSPKEPASVPHNAATLVQPGQFLLVGLGTSAATAALIAASPIVIAVTIPLAAGYVLYQVLEPGYVAGGAEIFADPQQAQYASGYVAASRVIGGTVTSPISIVKAQPSKNACIAASFSGFGPTPIKKSLQKANSPMLCAYVCELAMKEVCASGLSYELYGDCALRAGLAGPRLNCH
jgi:hypothetical protein